MNLKSIILIFPFIIFFAIIFSCERKEAGEELSNRNSISMNISSEPQTINPYYYSSGTEKLITIHLFQPLLIVENGQAYPILAESLPVISKDSSGTKVHYTLRSEAKWDNGQPVTSMDVLNTFKIILNPHSDLFSIKEYFSFIDSIQIINDQEFIFFTQSKNPLTLHNSGDIEITPQYLFDPENVLTTYSYAELKNYNPDMSLDSALLKIGENVLDIRILNNHQNIIGSGAYKLIDFQEGHKVVLEKKPNWWGDQFENENYLFKAYPDKIEFKIYVDNTSARLAFINNELDVLSGINSEDIDELKYDSALASRLSVKEIPALAFVYLGLNNKHPLLKDRNFRKAMAYICDIPTLLSGAFIFSGQEITGPISPSNTTYYNSDIKPISYSLDSARIMLRKAGCVLKDGKWYKNNQKISLDFVFQTGNKNSEDFAIYFNNQASKLGIDLNLIPLEFTTFISRIREGDYAITRLGMSTQNFSNDYRPLFHSQSIQENKNYVGFSNTKVDSLIALIENSDDEGQGILNGKELQKIIYEDFSYIFLYAPTLKVVFRDNLEGLEFSSSNSSPYPAAFKPKLDE